MLHSRDGAGMNIYEGVKGNRCEQSQGLDKALYLVHMCRTGRTVLLNTPVLHLMIF